MRTPSLARKAGSHVIVCHATGLQPCGGESDRHFRQDKTRHFLLFLTANFHVAKIQLKFHQNRIYFTYLTTIFTFSTLITYPNHPTPWGHPLSRIAIPHFFTPSTCPTACRDARSERPGNFVYNQSETDFFKFAGRSDRASLQVGVRCNEIHTKSAHTHVLSLRIVAIGIPSHHVVPYIIRYSVAVVRSPYDVVMKTPLPSKLKTVALGKYRHCAFHAPDNHAQGLPTALRV